MHMNRWSFHNLKKFLPFSSFEYTLLVQKNFNPKILPGSENYSVHLAFFNCRHRVIKTRNPLFKRVPEISDY
jgi:hypothetical protein